MTALAIVLLLLSLSAWVGQVLSAVAPALAAKWGLTEPESAVHPAFHADIRAECVWDAFTLWPAVVAAVLLLFGHPSWSIFGLIGGAVYLYFAGRGIAQRVALRRRGFAVGTPSNVRSAYVALSLWGLAGLSSIALASYTLLTQ